MPTSYESLKTCKTRPRVQSCSMAAHETDSELQQESDKSVYSHQPSLTSSYKESDDHVGSVSIGGRLITNFRFADEIFVNVEEEEAGVLVDRLDTTTTMYEMGIGPHKTKMTTNNPRYQDQRLEGMID